MKDKLPKRKSNRLKNHDYNKNGYYFVTLCLKDMRSLLWKSNVGSTYGRQHLTEIGMIVDKEIEKLNTVYNNMRIDKYVLMPNHIHMIVVIEEVKNGGRPEVAPTISRAMQQFKGSITKQVGFSIWQKSFHDHIIRNKESYQKIWMYIDTNPLKWAEDCYYVSP